MSDEPEPRWDGMRRVPCLFCTWAYVYDPIWPGRREVALRVAARHVIEEHGATE